MRITIAERLRPFSHTPGTLCLLPGSFLRFQIFPTRIVVDDLSHEDVERLMVIDLKLQGPVKDFTVQQDLERGRLNIWGHYQEGYVCYYLKVGENQKSFVLKMERGPEDGVMLEPENKAIKAKEQVTFTFPHEDVSMKGLPGRLSLGNHKAQDWDLVQRRGDLVEILPAWLSFGSQLPESSIRSHLLLDECLGKIAEGEKLSITRSFLNLFQACFEGILSPRLVDTQFQGFGAIEPSGGSPIALLTEGAKAILSCFIQIDKSIKILPVLPPEFHCGRLVGVSCGEFGDIDLEWSKKMIRCLIFHSKRTGPIPFVFQNKVKSFRIRGNAKEKGKRVSVTEQLQFEAGHTYLFDNFQK